MIKLHDNCVTPYVTIIIMQFIMAVFRETRFLLTLDHKLIGLEEHKIKKCIEVCLNHGSKQCYTI